MCAHGAHCAPGPPRGTEIRASALGTCLLVPAPPPSPSPAPLPLLWSSLTTCTPAPVSGRLLGTHTRVTTELRAVHPAPPASSVLRLLYRSSARQRAWFHPPPPPRGPFPSRLGRGARSPAATGKTLLLVQNPETRPGHRRVLAFGVSPWTANGDRQWSLPPGRFESPQTPSCKKQAAFSPIGFFVYI